MSTVHVFAIGGTGSRVLRSLTMMLAAGVKCDKGIRPVIIDPDHSNEDVSRTSILLQDYCNLRKDLSFDNSVSNTFFKTDINIEKGLRLPIENTSDKRFRDYLELSKMPVESQALIRGLFSEDDLDSKMEVGFEGHPNRGSVVLNQISRTKEFNEFANNFKQGDSIFIISSIFGGTGASGFPLLLKMLRETKDVQNHKLINDATIGAISVLPYFKVDNDDDSPIDSATFISKTRSALQYYKRTISDQNKIQCLYYIGDKKGKSYENNKGGQKQRNDAHFVELASALSIIDFANNQPDNKNLHKEYGIKADTPEINFKDLGDNTSELIKIPMIQMMLLCRLFSLHYESMKKQAYVENCGDHFLNSSWVVSFKKFLSDFHEWLKELAGNDISFNPFELDLSKALSADPLDFVRGHKCKRSLLGKKGFDRFDSVISKQSSSAHNSIQQFVDRLYDATRIMAKEDYVG